MGIEVLTFDELLSLGEDLAEEALERCAIFQYDGEETLEAAEKHTVKWLCEKYQLYVQKDLFKDIK
jgi:hypothetical protein